MIEIIDSKFCKDGVVKYSPYIGMAMNSHLIISTEEIILLNYQSHSLVNKYKPSLVINGYYSELFDYNKTYLHYSYSNDFYKNLKRLKFEQFCFMNYFDKTLRLSDELVVDEESKSFMEISYDDIRKLFNPANHNCDALYILQGNGDILFASSKKDGCIVNSKNIPSKQEYIGIHNGGKSYVEIPSCYMIKINNNIFDITYFEFHIIGVDKFIMTTISIPIIDSTLDIECVNEKIKIK